MSSRKEQKEALRLEREQREQAARAAERRKRLIGYGVGGALAVAALVVVVVLLVSGGGGGGGEAGAVLPDDGKVPKQTATDLKRAAAAENCELRNERAKSRDHTEDPAEVIKYETDPPMSGRHFQIEAEDGSYGQSPGENRLVHALEHGRVVIWFKPTLPEEARANLKALFDEDEYQMLLAPNKTMKYDVAATAWTREPVELGTGHLVGCPRFSDKVFDVLRTFRDEYRGNGPEAIP